MAQVVKRYLTKKFYHMLHLYLALSVYTPLSFQVDTSKVKYDSKKASTSLLVKIFSESITAGEDAATIPSNSGDRGVATLVIKNNKVTYLKNLSIPELEEKYPQLNKIRTLAESLADELDLSLHDHDPICKFAVKAHQPGNVVVHDMWFNL